MGKNHPCQGEDMLLFDPYLRLIKRDSTKVQFLGKIVEKDQELLENLTSIFVSFLFSTYFHFYLTLPSCLTSYSSIISSLILLPALFLQSNHS